MNVHSYSVFMCVCGQCKFIFFPIFCHPESANLSAQLTVSAWLKRRLQRSVQHRDEHAPAETRWFFPLILTAVVTVRKLTVRSRSVMEQDAELRWATEAVLLVMWMCD